MKRLYTLLLALLSVLMVQAYDAKIAKNAYQENYLNVKDDEPLRYRFETILAALPDTFTQNDVQQYRETHGLGSDSKMTISRWLEQGYITADVVNGQKCYKKVKNE